MFRVYKTYPLPLQAKLVKSNIWQYSDLRYEKRLKVSSRACLTGVQKDIVQCRQDSRRRKNKELFKKLDNSEIWEFRTLYNGTAYRLFAFWDTETHTLVVATHGIVKKTQKTPKKEIAKAEAIMKRYYELKNK